MGCAVVAWILHLTEHLELSPEEHHGVLLCAGAGVGGPPVDIRLAALRSMRRLLPRMHLAGYSSSIMHPLIRCLPQLPTQQ